MTRWSAARQVRTSSNGPILIAVLALLHLYAFADITTSASSGLGQVSRQAVHMTMLILGFLMALSLLNHFMRERQGRISLAPLPFVILPAWILLVDLVTAADLAASLVRLWLGVWWVLVFAFARMTAARMSRPQRLVLPLTSLVALYLVGMVWANQEIATRRTVDAVVNNFAYFVVALYPSIRLIPASWLRRALTLLVIVATLSSLKRGALIALVAMLLIGMVSSRVGVLVKAIPWVAALTLSSAFFWDLEVFEQLGRRFAPENLASGSGRFDIYSDLAQTFLARSFMTQLVGTGTGSLDVAAAHNDWLEMLLSYGLIGMVLYASWVLACARQARKISGREDSIHASIMMVVSYLIFAGLYSQAYFGHASVYAIALLGAGVGVLERKAGHG